MVNCMDKTSDDSKGELLDWRNHIIYFFFSYFELPYAVESNKIFTYILAGVLLIAVLLLWKKRKEMLLRQKMRLMRVQQIHRLKKLQSR